MANDDSKEGPGGAALPVRVAYITARYPPMRSSGTRRVEAMRRYLPTFGIWPVFVTLPPTWVEAQSGLEFEELRGDPFTVVRPTSPLDGAVQRLTQIPILRRATREALIPDVLSPWARWTGRHVKPSELDVEAVYATSPPFSALVFARHFATRTGLPWVAEVRDPPGFNRRLRGRSRLTLERMRRFERETFQEADLGVVVTPGTRRHILDRHPQLDPDRLIVIENGAPDDIHPTPVARSDRFTFTYVGSTNSAARGVDLSWSRPEVLLPFLAAHPHPAQLRIVGSVPEPRDSSLRAAWRRDQLDLVGFMPREQALGQVAAADCVVLLAEAGDDWWIGRKVYEALKFARTVLAILPPDGDAAELIRRHPDHWIVEPGNSKQLRAAITSILSRPRSTVAMVEADQSVEIQTDSDCARQVAEAIRSCLTPG